MHSLKITESAWRVIRKELKQTPVPDPVVYLIEASEGQAPPELARAIADGADPSVIEEILKRGVSLPKGRRRLLAAIYSRSQLSGWFFQVIDDVEFYFPPTISSKVARGTLDVGEDGLVLRDVNGRVIMPSD